MIITTKYGIIALVVLAGLIMIPGCAPSIRYTRGSSQITETETRKSTVPRNWDYRKSYKLPLSRLSSVINSWLGTPYRYGGINKRGVDCSGFVCVVFREINRAKLPHSTRKMRKYGKVVQLKQASPGDLVFFRNSLRSVNHVGIFMGNGKFAHASSSKGVIYSNLNDSYYSRRLLEVRRIF